MRNAPPRYLVGSDVSVTTVILGKVRRGFFVLDLFLAQRLGDWTGGICGLGVVVGDGCGNFRLWRRPF
jgi:hypothetical protein